MGSITINDEGVHIVNAKAHIGEVSYGNYTSNYSASFKWDQIKFFGKGGNTPEEMAAALSGADLDGLELIIAPLLASTMAKAADKTESMWKLMFVLEDDSWLFIGAGEFFEENDHVKLIESIEEESIACLENRHTVESGNPKGWIPTIGEGVQPHRARLVRAIGIIGIFFLPAALFAWWLGRSDLEKMANGKMDSSGEKLTRSGMNWGKVISIIYAVFIVIGILANLADKPSA